MATHTNQARSGSNDDIRPVVSNSAQIDDKADIEMNEFNKEIADDVIMKSPFEDQLEEDMGCIQESSPHVSVCFLLCRCRVSDAETYGE
jgi:hypothetical protein